MDTGDIILWSVILLAFGGYRLYTILYGESKYSMLNVGTWFLCAGVRLLKLISALKQGTALNDRAFLILLVVLAAVCLVLGLFPDRLTALFQSLAAQVL